MNSAVAPARAPPLDPDDSFPSLPYITLHSSRLILTHVRPSCNKHADFWLQLVNGPLSLHLNGSNAGIFTAEDAAAKIRAFDAARQETGLGVFVVYLKSETLPHSNDGGEENDNPDIDVDTAEPIGMSNVLRGAQSRYPDVGFNFAEAATGKGYASEAVQRLIEWAMRERGCEVVLGFTAAENQPARRLMRRVGMAERGVRQFKFYGVEKKMTVVYVYGLKGGAGGEEEWEELGLKEGMELRW